MLLDAAVHSLLNRIDAVKGVIFAQFRSRYVCERSRLLLHIVQQLSHPHPALSLHGIYEAVDPASGLLLRPDLAFLLLLNALHGGLHVLAAHGKPVLQRRQTLRELRDHAPGQPLHPIRQNRLLLRLHQPVQFLPEPVKTLPQLRLHLRIRPLLSQLPAPLIQSA